MLPIPLVRHHFCRLFRITVGILKHAKLKHFLQCTGNRAVQRLLSQYDLILLKSFRHRMFFIIIIDSTVIGFLPIPVIKKPADEIHAPMVHRISDTLRFVKDFHTPVHIMYNSRIRIDIPFKAHLLTQKSINKWFVIGKTI